MKKLSFLLMILYSLQVYAQFECVVDDGSPDIIVCDDVTLLYIPNEYTPTKTIKVNFHFMLKQNGTLNFTETDDGNGNNNFTGYDFADEIISIANNRLPVNEQMNLPQGNTTLVLDRAYDVVLAGVYFHRDDNNYSYQNSYLTGLMSTYGVNNGKEVNVFWVYDEDIPYENGGNANMSGNRAIRIKGAWQTYIDYGNAFWGITGTFLHELGHNLGLHHTVRAPDGTCWDVEDCCSDTPSRDELMDAGEPDPCCGWGNGSIPTCSNNMMDYSGKLAITPEQLGRVHYTIVNEMLDYLDDSYCEIDPNSTEIIISSGNTVTWNTAKIIYNDIIIESGAELKIEDTWIHMPDLSKIIVKQNGKLTVVNSTITNRCNKTWQGIEVWGNSNASQQPLPGQPYAHGKVVLNNAVIENARVAVSLMKGQDYNTAGGMIYATNSTFKNNLVSVVAYPYTNFNPNYPQYEWDYFSNFKNCTFVYNAEFPENSSFLTHIHFSGVRGIDFEGCDFTVAEEVPLADGIATGIRAFYAGFTAKAGCNVMVYPCPDDDECTFNGFNIAVLASGSQASQNTFRIDNAVFYNNTVGVKATDVDNITIIDSKFFIGPVNGSKECLELAAFSSGIELNGCTGFAIEDNEFAKIPNAPAGNYIGVYISETNATDEVYNNDFNNLTYGNYSVGQNWGYDIYHGLAYLCNTNTGTEKDDFSVQKKDDEGGIQAQIGSTNMTAGNTFSSNAEYNFNNRGNHLVGYYYYDTPPEYPDIVHQLTREAVAVQNPCLSHYGGGGSGTRSLLLTPEQRLEAELEFADGLSDYNNVKALYDNLVDGGNTTGELLDIATAQSGDMWELRAQLLGNSPHLSMEVLKAAADKTDVLPESAIFDILAANPDELKKEELISYLADKENPLPDYMINILQQVATGTTYKTVLQLEMAQANRIKTRAAHDIIRSILNDSIIDYTDLRNWLDNLGGIRSDEQIIASYMHEGNYSDALSLAGMMPALYEYNSEDIVEHQYYMDMLNLQINLEQQEHNMLQLNDTEIENLVYIAENSSATAGTQAKGILGIGYGYNYCNCIAADTTGLKNSGVVNKGAFTKVEDVTINVQPNPARKWAAFNYSLPGNASGATIKITDVTGKLVLILQLNDKQGQEIWDTRKVKPGVYMYQLEYKGAVKSGKVVVQH